MTAIITGINGQDGSYMAELLISKGIRVIGTMRRTSQIIDSNLEEVKEHPNFSIECVDLCDAHSVSAIVQKYKPDYFINFGAQTFVADSWNQPELHLQVNTIGVLRCLEAIRQYAPNCRFYSSGSSEEWGDVVYSPQDLLHPKRPRSPYGVSKVAAGLLCKVYRESYGLFAVHGVLNNHESERRQEHFVSQKIAGEVARWMKDYQCKFTPRPIELGNLDAKRDWSHAEDFMDGVWKMLNQPKPKDYVLASGEARSVREFLVLALEFAGFDLEHISTEGSEQNEKWYYDSKLLLRINPKFYRPAEVDLLQGDPTIAKLDLNWEPKIDFEQLVQRMVCNRL